MLRRVTMSSNDLSEITNELRGIRFVLASFAIIEIALSIGLVYLVAKIAFE
jgi:hypothetical protein